MDGLEQQILMAAADSPTNVENLNRKKDSEHDYQFDLKENIFVADDF